MIAGFKSYHNAPSVSHLLFANDSLILFHANESDAQQLQSILSIYDTTRNVLIGDDPFIYVTKAGQFVKVRICIMILT